MANKNIQFHSHTLKNESESYIKGSNGLYYFSFGTGTNRDLRQELINYHASKHGLDSMVKDSNPSKNIGESFWGIFKKPDEQSYEDFINDVKNSRVGFVGNSPIIPIGRDYTRVDTNGNLLVATINSKLDNYMDGCGNMLISGKTGEVIRSPKPSIIINPADKTTGFYKVEVYKTKENRDTGAKEVYDREYNFLDSEGKILCDEHDFAWTGEDVIYEVPRNFYMRDGKSMCNDWNIYPKAYVHCTWDGVTLYPSVVDLIEESRARVARGEDPLVKDEKVYMESYYKRKVELEEITEKFGRLYDQGSMSENIYSNIMRLLSAEYDDIEYFDDNLATNADREIEDSVLLGLESSKETR